jgi:ParB-like chromosome segregation protein Spo0J
MGKHGDLKTIGGLRPSGEVETIERLTSRLVEAIAALSVPVRVDAINAAREALHEVSPFRDEPVDLVTWVKAENVVANDYNPNAVAPPEMKLLTYSIEANGYTQPIVVHRGEDGDVVVDGYHRNRVGREVPGIRRRLHGYLPVTRIRTGRSDIMSRIAATVQHNRARGEHGVDRMSALVRQLYEAGWKDDQIQRELGMELDEVLRLKQVTGLAALFADREFSEAWEAE